MHTQLRDQINASLPTSTHDLNIEHSDLLAAAVNLTNLLHGPSTNQSRNANSGISQSLPTEIGGLLALLTENLVKYNGDDEVRIDGVSSLFSFLRSRVFYDDDFQLVQKFSTALHEHETAMSDLRERLYAAEEERKQLQVRDWSLSNWSHLT